jgi:hypothetical protein
VHEESLVVAMTIKIPKIGNEFEITSALFLIPHILKVICKTLERHNTKTFISESCFRQVNKLLDIKHSENLKYK